MRDFLHLDAAACLLGALLLLVLPLQWLLAALTAAAFHELGHYLAVRLLGGKVLDIRIGPGGAEMQTMPMSRGRALVCSLAGPAASLLLVTLCRVFPRLAFCALVQGVYNLLPVFPLDGGRALGFALERLTPKWASRICRWTKVGTLTALGAAAFLASFWLHLGILPLIAFLFLVIRSSKEINLANRAGSGYNSIQ